MFVASTLLGGRVLHRERSQVSEKSSNTSPDSNVDPYLTYALYALLTCVLADVLNPHSRANSGPQNIDQELRKRGENVPRLSTQIRQGPCLRSSASRRSYQDDRADSGRLVSPRGGDTKMHVALSILVLEHH